MTLVTSEYPIIKTANEVNEMVENKINEIVKNEDKNSNEGRFKSYEKRRRED